MIHVLPNAFPKELICEIKESANVILQGKNKDISFHRSWNRGGDTINISEESSLKELDNKISSFMSEFSTRFVKYEFCPMFDSADSGYEYHRYYPKDSCYIHADGELALSENGNGLIRYATIVVHLNTVKEGGETVFPNQGKTIKTVEGQIVVFPPYGNYKHYVNMSNEQREILMTWCVYSGLNVYRT